MLYMNFYLDKCQTPSLKKSKSGMNCKNLQGKKEKKNSITAALHGFTETSFKGENIPVIKRKHRP